MASTTLVNTADAAELRLVHFLGDHDATSPFILSCETAITQTDAAALLTTIVNHQPAFDRIISDEEGIGAFSLLAALLDRVHDADQAQDIMKGLVGAVEAANGNGNVEDAILVKSKIDMLCALYNLRAGSEKCWILARIFNLAAFSGDEAAILTLLPGRNSTLGHLLEGTNLERLLMEFDKDVSGLKEDDQRALYSVATKVVGRVAEVCKAKDMENEAATAESAKQRFLLKILSTYSSTSNVDDEARSVAKAAAIGSIRDPVTLFYEQRIIMSLPPVAALKHSDNDVYDLLEIFQQGKLEDFQSFIKANPNTLSNNNISEDDAIRHMRLLSLCSLATEHEEIPYDAIASTLQVDESVVENWVIDAVSSGLLSAKMDQLQNVVMVERCVVRRFGIEQWKILQERLNVWKKNVKGVLEGLKQSQI